ncbi:MAG: CAP domain-containing protein, partial [Acidobacteriota bacterium]|nr:CAP domain-containing protein [Acidobacteriota bacterium]
ILWLLAAVGCEQIFSPTSSLEASDVEQEMFRLVNEHRASLGMAALTWNDDIAEVARGHSQDMADGTVSFGHDGFDDRMNRIAAIMSCTVFVGEVVAYSDSAENAVNALIASADHKDVLEGEYELTGVGVVVESSGGSFYATQMFVHR